MNSEELKALEALLDTAGEHYSQPPPEPPPVVTSRTVTVTVEEDGWKPVTVEVTQERG